MFEVQTRDGVQCLTLSHPPVNAIDPAWVAAFAERLDALEGSKDVVVLHLRSALRVFCAGADLKLMRDCFTLEAGVERLVAHVRAMQQLYDRIEALPQVVLAEIGGAAHGGGLELALACDLRIVADEATLGLPEAGLGLVPGAGGTQRLQRLCGPGLARRLILAGERLSGVEAVHAGLAQWSAPLDALPARAGEIARRIAALSPAGLAACKRCLRAGEDALQTGLLIERLETERLLHHPDTRRRVSSFLER